MRFITTQHIRTHGFQTAEAFKVYFGLEYLKCEAIRTAHSAIMTASNPRKGVRHTPEALGCMSVARKGKGQGVAGKYTRTREIRSRIADGVIRAWETGKRGRGYRVFSTKAQRRVWVRSSWEERVVRVLDASLRVRHFEEEPFQIPYILDGVERRYTPDFLVVSNDGIKELWEIKPDRFLDHPMNVAKFVALNAWCSANGYNARIVTLKDIEEMER